MPSLVLGLLACLALPARGSTSPAADLQLSQGKYRLAASKYQQGLKERPDDQSLQVGLARAWAGLGWCERALPALEGAYGTEHYDHGTAMSLGSCLTDLGRHAEAVAAFEDAVVLTADASGATVKLAWAAFLGGDPVTLDTVTDQMEADDPLHKGTLLLLGLRAFRAGDDALMRAHLDELQDRQRRAPNADLLRAWSALQVGDTDAARQHLRGPTRFYRLNMPDIATWLVEASRRAGDLDEARRLAEEQIREREIPPIRAALRLRLQADLEGPEAAAAEAQALLAALPLEPEVVATAWYVATLQGAQDRADALRRRYEALEPVAAQPLDLLLPPPLESP